jgi:hypothetical protein
MNETPSDFDLKLMPDWLKEAPAKNPYADYEVRDQDRRGRDFGGARSGPPGGRRDKPRRADDRRREEKRGPHQKSHGPPRDRRGDRQKPGFQGAPRPVQPAEVKPAAVQIEFLPDPHCVASIAKQIKGSHRACPIFGLAKMFLAKPERHRVRITAAASGTPLFQLGENGPVSLDRAILERHAFAAVQDQFYAAETTQREPLKGNFTNVARCRLTGKLLGPTNYHAYQPALRKLYEAHFSRRMTFQDYLREIEISTQPEAVEAWKEQARNVTTYKTLKESEPLGFQSLEETERHFRENYLPQLIQSGPGFEISGETSRALQDRRIAGAVKQAWEKEISFPGQMMHHLRRELCEAGLHFFKHRKRIQYIAAIRPLRFKETGQAISESIAAILRVIETTPKCTRQDLAHHILESKQNDPELAKLKAALASDLHWLISEGHVIEFQDGKLDLPLLPKQLENEPANEPVEPVFPVKEPAPPAAAAEQPAPPGIPPAGEA